MVPIWKRPKSKVTKEEYNNFYTEKFSDFMPPLKVIHSSVEGQFTYTALLYIPSHLPYDYYSKEYEKGLQLYSNGVLIMDKCKDLLPDYFSFVKGVVDSPDLSLNISREMLQQDKNLKLIAKNIETKIIKELTSMMKEDKEKYETQEENIMSFNWKASGLFAAGVAFGTAGIKILSSKDAKRAYTQCTAAALRAKDCVMKTVNTVQENAEDILAEAKSINDEREAKAEAAKVSDASEDVCECAKADKQEAEQAEVTAETAEA